MRSSLDVDQIYISTPMSCCRRWVSRALSLPTWSRANSLARLFEMVLFRLFTSPMIAFQVFPSRTPWETSELCFLMYSSLSDLISVKFSAAQALMTSFSQDVLDLLYSLLAIPIRDRNSYPLKPIDDFRAAFHKDPPGGLLQFVN